MTFRRCVSGGSHQTWGWTIRGYLNQSYRGIVSAVVAEFLLVRETLMRMQADKIPVRLEGNRQII